MDNDERELPTPIIQSESDEAVAETEEDDLPEGQPPEIQEDEFRVSEEDRSVHPQKKSYRKIIALVLVGLLVGGTALGFGIGAGIKYFDSSKFNNVYYMENKDAQATTPVSLLPGNKSIVSIAEQVGPSVVPITSKVTVQDMFMNQTQAEGSGSGVVFSITKDSILIMTNNHVVDGATEVLVGITDSLTLKAQLVGVDPETDLAVVKLDKSQVPAEQLAKVKPATLGNSDNVKVGETAIAIGNPLGYSRTVTAGIISALDRKVDASLNRLNLIQTDAAINPGNSGGALVNSNGEVIGINTIKIADTKVEGIGFAIPINSAKPVIDQLLTKGYVSRPYLGISGRNIDQEMSKLYEIPIGVIVMEVLPGSSAAEAGVQKGDVLISFDGKTVTTMEQLIKLISDHKVGDKVQMKLIRTGSVKIEASVTLKDKNPN